MALYREPPAPRKKRCVTFKLTDYEYEQLKRASEKADLTMSEFICSKIFIEKDKAAK